MKTKDIRITIKVTEEFLKTIQEHARRHNFKSMKEFVLGAIITTMAKQKGADERKM